MTSQEEMAAVLAAVFAYMESEGGPIGRAPSRWREAGRAELMEGTPLRQRREVPFSRAIPGYPGRRANGGKRAKAQI